MLDWTEVGLILLRHKRTNQQFMVVLGVSEEPYEEGGTLWGDLFTGPPWSLLDYYRQDSFKLTNGFNKSYMTFEGYASTRAEEFRESVPLSGEPEWDGVVDISVKISPRQRQNADETALKVFIETKSTMPLLDSSLLARRNGTPVETDLFFWP